MARGARLAAAAALALALPARAGLPPRYGGELALALPPWPADLDPARASSASELLAARAVHATLVEADASGALRPGLLAALPEAEPGGRAFRLRLRPGLRFHGGAPLGAAEVAASLARLAAPASPHGWIVLPVKGAGEVRAGRAAALSGVQVISDAELRVELELPFPGFPQALAALPAAVVRAAAPGEGAGPFRRTGEIPGGLRLVAFDGFFRGRAFADGLVLRGLDARRAARAFARGEIDLAVRPEPVPGAAATAPLPAVTVTWALANASRLGSEAAAVRGALLAVDRGELARFVRGPAVPLWNPLPPALWPAPAAPPAAPAPAPARPGPRLSLLVPSGDVSRSVADRLQVRLFDRGVRVAVEALPPEAFAARLAAGNFDLALLSRTLAAPAPAAAALEVAWALGGPAAARRALARLAGADPGAAAAEAAEEAGAIPLLATGLVASPRAGLHGLVPLPDGGFDPGDLWTLPAGAP
jgi:peptide/nickel transport system substrate-binding protein